MADPYIARDIANYLRDRRKALQAKVELVEVANADGSGCLVLRVVDPTFTLTEHDIGLAARRFWPKIKDRYVVPTGDDTHEVSIISREAS